MFNPGGNSPPRSGVSMLTAWFFARASRGRMAVGRVTAGILPLAKRGEEPRASRAARRDAVDAQVGSKFSFLNQFHLIVTRHVIAKYLYCR